MTTKRAALLAVTALLLGVCAVGSFVQADYTVSDRGLWPEGWPKELDPLRKGAKTYEGPLGNRKRHVISFTNREAFEAAWPHILKVKTPGAPVILVKPSKDAFFEVLPAGVVIHEPPTDEAIDRPNDGKGIPLMDTIHIVLIVDGEVVDLNRIPLPADTPIIDQRFVEKKDGNKKAIAPGNAGSNTKPAAPPASEPDIKKK
jgi:hypothetical protein